MKRKLKKLPKLRIPLGDRPPKFMSKSKKDKNRNERRKSKRNGYEE